MKVGIRELGLAGLLWAIGAMTGAAEEANVRVLWSKTYIKRDTGPLNADVYMPAGDGPFPGMLVVHGGAWRVGTRAQLASAATKFAEHGYTAVAISYRLAPKSTFPAQIYDCQAAVRWMRAHAQELKIDGARIGGFGYSAGGHLVTLLGTLDDDDIKEEGVGRDAPSARLQCVLAGGAPCDFRDVPLQSRTLAYWLAGSRAEQPQNYKIASPAHFITQDDPPMYFFSGESDYLVPISSSQQMVAALQGAGLTAELFTINNAGHIQALFDRRALEGALKFAEKNLKNAPPARPHEPGTDGKRHGN